MRSHIDIIREYGKKGVLPDTSTARLAGAKINTKISNDLDTHPVYNWYMVGDLLKGFHELIIENGYIQKHYTNNTKVNLDLIAVVCVWLKQSKLGVIANEYYPGCRIIGEHVYGIKDTENNIHMHKLLGLHIDVITTQYIASVNEGFQNNFTRHHNLHKKISIMLCCAMYRDYDIKKFLDREFEILVYNHNATTVESKNNLILKTIKKVNTLLGVRGKVKFPDWFKNKYKVEILVGQEILDELLNGPRKLILKDDKLIYG